MKTGLENKRNVAILSVLAVILLGCAYYFVNAMFLSGGAPAAPAAAQAPAAAPAATVRQSGTNAGGGSGPAATKVISLANLDPTLHPEVMAGAESLKYTGDGRNIFSMSSAPAQTQKIEAVKGPIRPGNATVAQASGPPPPPPMNLTFFGYEAQNGVKQAFLLHGDDVFIAKEGDVVDHHFKVLKINPVSILVMDLLYNDTQTLPLAQS